jgi:hypothetical protein
MLMRYAPGHGSLGFAIRRVAPNNTLHFWFHVDWGWGSVLQSGAALETSGYETSLAILAKKCRLAAEIEPWQRYQAEGKNRLKAFDLFVVPVKL